MRNERVRVLWGKEVQKNREITRKEREEERTERDGERKEIGK